jgi:hypothetical protein
MYSPQEPRVYDNRSGRIIYAQMSPQELTHGTGTNQGTRDYVNDPNTPVPQYVQTSYSMSGGQTGHTEFQNLPSHSGRWAAGHTFARQNGGPGNVNSGVFPQNSQINSGNSYNGTPTYDTWRRHEQNINTALRSGQTVGQAVHLNNQVRTPYGPHSEGWNDPSDSDDSDYDEY